MAHLRHLVAACSGVFAVATLAGCGSGGAAGSPTGAPGERTHGGRAPGVGLSPSSVETTTSSWATLPMGDPSQPGGVYWQLFERPSRPGASWSDVADAAVATNGGVLLAAGGPAVAAGVLPYDKLTFSPLIEEAGLGAGAPTSGLLDAGLAPLTDGLALAADGAAVALGGPEPQVYAAAAGADLGVWGPLGGVRTLAATAAGRACGVVSLTAVAADPGAMVGGGCSLPGTIGLWRRSGAGWVGAGPSLPGAVANDTAAVLAIGRGSAGPTLLATLSGPGGGAVLPAWTAPGGSWDTGPALRLPAGNTLRAYGSAVGDDLYVLAVGAGGRAHAWIARRGTAGWVALAAPPAGSVVLVWPAGGAPEALDPEGSVLDVWQLDATGATWREVQRLPVSLQPADGAG